MEGRAEPVLSEVDWIASVKLGMTAHAPPICKENSAKLLNLVSHFRRGSEGQSRLAEFCLSILLPTR